MEGIGPRRIFLRRQGGCVAAAGAGNLVDEKNRHVTKPLDATSGPCITRYVYNTTFQAEGQLNMVLVSLEALVCLSGFYATGQSVRPLASNLVQ